MPQLITYKEKDCFVHRLSGLTKLVFFLLWTLTSMLSYDTRVLVSMFCLSALVFYVSKIEWSQISAVIKAMAFFLILNVTAIFIFSPYEGCKIYNSRTDLFFIAGNYTLTFQQLFYEANIVLKYCTIVPAVLVFVTATNPSEFASALNRVGLPYTVSYAVSLSLRYVPDIQNDFVKIKNAQSARGIEMSGKANIFKRIKNVAAIIFPLVFTSMERIDTISSAMELRGFGKKKKRSWYAARPLSKYDFICLTCTIILCVTALFITYKDGSRFYNPF